MGVAEAEAVVVLSVGGAEAVVDGGVVGCVMGWLSSPRDWKALSQ